MILKWAGRIFGALLLGVIVLAAFNWGRLQRLQSSLSLFDADKIVHNFSHMDEAFLTRDIPVSGDVHIWDEQPRPLPQTIMIDGQSRDLQGFLDETATTSLLVIQGNDIVHEGYYLGTHAHDRRISWSVSKSFISALIGMSLERGEIKSLEDKVTDYVPDLAGSAYADASILNVLHMASGVQFDEEYLDFNSDISRMGRVVALGGSMDKFAASLTQQARPPGTGKYYVSVDTHVLGMVLRAAAGQSVHELLEQRLWSKIGAANDAAFLTDGKGVAFVLGGLNITSRDYARFGALFRDDGRSMGGQLIPEGWVAESTRKSAPPDVEGTAQDYGLHWWIPRNPMSSVTSVSSGNSGSEATSMEEDEGGEFFANGIYGQTVYVNSAADMIIVKTSANIDFEGQTRSGLTYKSETVDMMQSLVRHYADFP